MDREKVTKPTAQVGFIQYVLIPLYESLARLFPEIRVRAFTNYGNIGVDCFSTVSQIKMILLGGGRFVHPF